MLLSDAAYKKILWIRGEYAREFPRDPPMTLGLGIGQFISKAGDKAPANVAVGFFQRSEITPAIRAAQRSIRGLNYVIMGPPETKKMIGESLVDYSETKGFFLRPVGGGEPLAADSLFPANFSPLKPTRSV
jgi:hypothetical protein